MGLDVVGFVVAGLIGMAVVVVLIGYAIMFR